MIKQSTLSVARLEAVRVAPIWNGCGEPILAHETIPVKQRARQTLTAVRTLTETLRLYSWRVDATGGIYCTGTITADVRGVVQIALVRAQKYVTACRTAHCIHLQSWDVSNTGAIYGLVPAARLEGAYSWVTLLALGPTQLVTIALTQTGFWQLTAWRLGEDGLLYRGGNVAMPAPATGALAALALTTSTRGSTFVVVNHSQTNQLCWQQWCCTPEGHLILLAELEVDFPDVIEVALVRHGNGWLTLLQTAQGKLSLVVDIDIQHTNHGHVGAIYPVADRVAHFAVTRDADQLLIAYSGTGDHVPEPLDLLHGQPAQTFVHLQRWQVNSWTCQPTAMGMLSVADPTDLQLCDEALDGHAPYLTAIGTADGALHLTTWRSVV